jgi:hypothetical protein
LLAQRTCANNTAVKYIKNFHKIINQCLANGWLNKITQLQAKVKEVREFLSSRNRTNIKQNLFRTIGTRSRYICFSCFTGLVYRCEINKDNIALGIDGDKWIFRTDKKNRYLLNSITTNGMKIIDKYADHPVCKNEKRTPLFLNRQK